MRLGFGEFILDLGTRELLRGGQAVSVSPKAFQLLELLVRQRPDALSKKNVIGRDENASIWVDDVSISRHHARIVIDGGGARLEDLGSKNGTYVSDRKIAAAVELSDGDAVRLGSVNLVFRRLDTGVSTATVTGSG